MDFLTKELIKTYSYTTMTKDRDGIKEFVVNGRHFCKFGQYQAVTLIGKLYKVYDPSVKLFKHVLHVGVAMQHPSDIVINKPLAWETAETNALMNPKWTMEVGDLYSNRQFVAMAEAWIDALDLKFVATAQELDLKKNICKE